MKQAKTTGMQMLFVVIGYASVGLARNPQVDHVIHISVDGLRGSVIEQMGPANLPNFYRVRAEGAYTDNARTLFENTVTMPNHIAMLTGRPRDGSNGHHVVRNSDPGDGGSFVPGAVDITSSPGEFVRGNGALRIDNGSGGNYVHVNGNVVIGSAGARTSTVMGWYRYEDIDGDRSDPRNFVWETGPSDWTLSFGIRDSGGQKRAQWFTKDPSTGGNAASLPVVDDGQWHHAAVVIDEANDRLSYYHDGQIVDDVVIPGLNLADGSGAAQFFIGSHRAGDGTRNWDGFIDDMAVVNGLLGPNQIEGIYDGSLSVPQAAGTDLVAHWTFDSDLSSVVNNDLYQGRAVLDIGGGATVHSDSARAGGEPYVPSVFDVVHDRGGKTSFYAGWNGFNFIQNSWDDDSGAPDAVGIDNGTGKIDTYSLTTSDNIAAQNSELIDELTSDPSHYSLVHWHETDSRGHGSGWTSSQYRDAVRRVDTELGRLIDLINSDPVLSGNTAIVLTSDHGGSGTGHGDTTNRETFTVPFYVWIAGERIGADLYSLNETTRLDPVELSPDYSIDLQPIRNGDSGNLVLDLLGLPPIPGSTFNASHDLALVVPEPYNSRFLIFAISLVFGFWRIRKSHHCVRFDR